jgi:hypothetical protein
MSKQGKMSKYDKGLQEEQEAQEALLGGASGARTNACHGNITKISARALAVTCFAYGVAYITKSGALKATGLVSPEKLTVKVSSSCPWPEFMQFKCGQANTGINNAALYCNGVALHGRYATNPDGSFVVKQSVNFKTPVVWGYDLPADPTCKWTLFVNNDDLPIDVTKAPCTAEPTVVPGVPCSDGMAYNLSQVKKSFGALVFSDWPSSCKPPKTDMTTYFHSDADAPGILTSGRCFMYKDFNSTECGNEAIVFHSPNGGKGCPLPPTITVGGSKSTLYIVDPKVKTVMPRF